MNEEKKKSRRCGTFSFAFKELEDGLTLWNQVILSLLKEKFRINFVETLMEKMIQLCRIEVTLPGLKFRVKVLWVSSELTSDVPISQLYQRGISADSTQLVFLDKFSQQLN